MKQARAVLRAKKAAYQRGWRSRNASKLPELRVKWRTSGIRKVLLPEGSAFTAAPAISKRSRSLFDRLARLVGRIS